MELLDVPFPALTNGTVLVRNHFSLISAGTEGKTVKDARLSYIGKAKARKEEVRKVIQSAKTYGIMNTYNMVMNKLDAPSALGYSCAGEIIAVADDVKEFKVGDRVACGGNGAVHSELVSVSKNLCVKIADNVLIEHASFTTLGSIALQGIRQADLRLGENCVVIGLGLLGQLTIQMLNAAGVKTIGIDIDSKMVNLASEIGANLTLERNRDDIIPIINDFTKGFGTDAVIITAGTPSTDPVNLAGILCRKKGKVIIVGAVPTGFERPNYFKKELDLRMSCSYGPGRYDSEYEEKGIDYPIGHVRWTENRNMQAFVDLLSSGKVNLDKLITHVYSFEDAPKAYQLILDKTEPFIGILLKYNLTKNLLDKQVIESRGFEKNDTNIGLIGAGSFGQNFLLPAMKGNANFVGVATSRPNNAKNIAKKYNFNYCTCNGDDLIADNNINTIFIATRHDSHAQFVLKAMDADKNVFVEKPLCLTPLELELIKEKYEAKKLHLMVGFNRRFSPFVQKIKTIFNKNQPLAINYRINAGIIPTDHWVHDPIIGGGRIIGEVCHFIDLAMYISGSPIISVSANTMDESSNLNDTLIISLKFENGSVANICYFSNGNKLVNKEYLEVFGSGIVCTVNDFKTLTVYGKTLKTEKINLDKGHNAEIKAYLSAIRNGKNTPIPFKEIYNTTLATFKVLESITKKGKDIYLGENEVN